MAAESIPAAERAKVFISYRRSDTKAISRLICEHLRGRYGGENVFFDIDNIPIAADFVDYLSQSVSECHVVLAIIGDRWVGASSFADDDFVQIELRTAMAKGIPVIPIFADGAVPPKAEELPEDIRPLLRRNGLSVDSGRDFVNHIAAVCHHIDRLAQLHLDAKHQQAVSQVAGQKKPAPREIRPPFAKKTTVQRLLIFAVLVGAGGMVGVALKSTGSSETGSVVDLSKSSQQAFVHTSKALPATSAPTVEAGAPALSALPAPSFVSSLARISDSSAKDKTPTSSHPISTYKNRPETGAKVAKPEASSAWSPSAAGF